MPLFPKPSFSYDCDAQLRSANTRRPGPVATSRTRRLTTHPFATWIIATLRVRQRRAEGCRLSAEIVSWFDVVALHVGAAGTVAF